jgi:outer membrane protein assembly factor BamB
MVLWQGSRPSLNGVATVAAGNLLVTTRRESLAPGGTLIVAHDLSAGQELWTARLPIDTQPAGRLPRVTGVRDGQVYVTQSAWDRPDYLYALEAATGALRWRSEQQVRESSTESVSFASNGDLIVGDPVALTRMDHTNGLTVWSTPRAGPNDGSAAAVLGGRVYGWEFTPGGNGPRVGAFDAATGARLYSSPVIGACVLCSQQVALFVGPDGTVYAPRKQGNDWIDQLAALQDTGSSLVVKWSVPLGGGAFTSFGVGPDGSVYSCTPDQRIVRLDPATGSVRNASDRFAVEPFSPRLAIDAKGTLFLSTGHYGDQGRLHSFNPDLTLRWVVDVPGALFGGPVLAATGALVIGGSGTNVTAYWTPSVEWSVGAVGDFDGDSKPDLLWRSEDGRLVAWFMNDLVRDRGRFVDPPQMSPTWRVTGQGDFNHDAKADLLWRHQGSGEIVVWHMDRERVASGTFTTPAALSDLEWRIVGTGDFNADGRTDILWQHIRSGQVVVWFMDGTTLVSGSFTSPATASDTAWRIEGTGDFDADGQPDVLWRHSTSGQVMIWIMSGVALARTTVTSPSSADLEWEIQAASDLNRDGATDILWRRRSGQLRAWLMKGSAVMEDAVLTPDLFLTLNQAGAGRVTPVTGEGGALH